MAAESLSLNWPYAYGKPEQSARFRTQPEDFKVTETLGFAPSGEGEHVLLQLQKRGQNTSWVARQLADFAGVSQRDVGYCGLKDRHAVTTQWFSVHLPGNGSVNWADWQLADTAILQVSRHHKKLRPGQHQSNQFTITLRDVADPAAVQPRLTFIAEAVPNYFGEQRFGREGSNLVQAKQLLIERRPIKNRRQRGLMISAARAYLFNQVLAARVADGNWHERLPGDPESEPSGPLWGRGRPLVQSPLAEFEQAQLQPLAAWCHGLEHVGLQQERRPLVCRPRDCHADWQGTTLTLSFGLPPGQYATAVLRELCRLIHADAHSEPVL